MKMKLDSQNIDFKKMSSNEAKKFAQSTFLKINDVDPKGIVDVLYDYAFDFYKMSFCYDDRSSYVVVFIGREGFVGQNSLLLCCLFFAEEHNQDSWDADVPSPLLDYALKYIHSKFHKLVMVDKWAIVLGVVEGDVLGGNLAFDIFFSDMCKLCSSSTWQNVFTETKDIDLRYESFDGTASFYDKVRSSTSYKLYGIRIFSPASGCSFNQVKSAILEHLKNTLSRIKRSEDSKVNPQSFFKQWQQTTHSSEQSICKELLKKFDRKISQTYDMQQIVDCFAIILLNVYSSYHDLRKKWGSHFTDAGYKRVPNYAYTMCQKMIDQKLHPEKLIDRNYWWELIPDHVYKAMVSRAAHPEKSRGVQRKTIVECLSYLCKDAMILEVQSNKSLVDKILKSSSIYKRISDITRAFNAKKDSKFINSLKDKHGHDEKDEDYFVNNEYQELVIYMIYYLFGCCASFVDKDTASNDYEGGHYEDMEGHSAYGFDVSIDTSEYVTIEEMYDDLNEIDYNGTDQQLIAGISKVVDRAHSRGSLAGCFVQGGSETCNYVSNMKSDEMWENKSKMKHTRKQILEAIKHWTKVLNESEEDEQDAQQWLVDFSDDEDGKQTAAFSSKQEASIWIRNREMQDRYDPTGFEVLKGPYLG